MLKVIIVVLVVALLTLAVFFVVICRRLAKALTLARHRGHCRYRLNGARLTCEVLLAD